MLPGKGRKPLAWEKLQGKVISPGTAPPYKLSRTITRSICSRSFYKEQGSNAGSTVDGQHISSALHQQNGRDQVPNFGLPSKKSLVMVSQTSDCARRPTYRRRFKYSGQQGVPYLCGQQRLETRTPSVRQSKSGLGPPRGRSIIFATRLSKHLPRFVSWRPNPETKSVNAWAQDWSNFRGYAFFPFSLVGRCLKQVQTQNVPTLVLIAPVRRTQPSWYSLLLELSMTSPRLLPPIPGLLTKIQEVHPLTNLQLAGWLVSIDHTWQQVFQNQLKTCFSRHEERILPILIPQLGRKGPAGVETKN